MTETAEVVLSYPPMAIYADGLHYKRTADEPWTAQVTLSPNPGALSVPNSVAKLTILGDLPPTRVVQQSTRHWGVRDWLVDPCVGVGSDGARNMLRTELPSEPCWMQWWTWYRLTMVAQPITCFTTLLLENGKQYTGNLLLAACPMSLFPPPITAAQVQAKGTLTRVQ